MSNSKEMFPRADLKFRAKSTLKGNWRSTLVTVLIYLACASVLTSISNRFSEASADTIAKAVIQIVVMLVGGILVHGILEYSICKFFVNMAHKDEVVFGDFVEGFSDAGRAVVAYIWQVLCIALWCLSLLPGMIVYALGVNSGSAGLQAVAGVLFIVAFCFIVARVIRYVCQYMIMADAPEVNGRDALTYSVAMTKGHVWDLIKLDISFFFWGVLVAITLGLAAFYVMPYMYETNVQAYQWMRDEAFREGRLDPAALGYKKNNV